MKKNINLNPKDQRLNISNSQLWPLFGNDYKQAQYTILELLKNSPTHNQLLHLAVSNGLYQDVRKIMEDHPLSINTRATLNYRLNLKNQNPNGALDAICTKESKELAKAIIKQSTSERKIIEIYVIDAAGIGDHLESYCFIHNWQKKSQLNFNILTGNKRASQLARYCRTMANTSLIVGAEKCQRLFPYKYWLQKDNFNYFQHSIRDLSHNKKDKDILCCWSAHGAGEPFSRHSRSVPFNLAYDFYISIKNKKSLTSITDITDWHPWEKNTLAQLGIQCVNPSQSDVYGLAEVAAQHRCIISIDTALAHLCAVSNLKAHLLLNLYPDERWNYLLQPDTCYSRNLKIYRQSAFGDWSSTIKALTEEVDTNKL